MALATEKKSTNPLLIPNTFRLYRPILSHSLKEHFSSFSLSLRDFSSLMPLLISDYAPNVAIPWLLNGDNWEDAIVDMFKIHALTQNSDPAGPNVMNVTALSVFMDWRQDSRTRKPIHGREGEVAIVQGQASFSKAMATLMKHTAGINNFVNLDAHSHTALDQFRAEGIDTMNLTAAFLMADEIKKLNLIRSDLDTMICGIDAGNLPLVKALSQYLDLPIAIIRKWRESIMGGVQSKTHHELIFGNVRGKRIILVDDMISSGGTIKKTVDELLKNGAKEIIICATHAVLSGNDYYKNIQEVLELEEVRLVMTTNTIPLERPNGREKDRPFILKEDGEKKKLEILDIDNFIIWTLGILLNSKNFDEAKQKLKPHTLQLEDPAIIYEEITGQKMPKPKETAIYRKGGELHPLPQK
ncbi:MAG: ribose-phosphate pyrophosphokinase [Candidatus Pacebacteria bacterium]|jgi:phosphoribosylpyrophosphate synthetase|nr:ribose-phosphate pyrophosphokinase [Candidatus Paceibacterota bacterium]MBT3511571.1 ribose-phosphate pyrophosphokinase [Candidatus Paceibacterota bacterium]MBT4004959.1 ribose-phosphate pyrophosphokinase [Candidatus Paceibacterota bacterium]MBT4358735.1 ribose-phosphate pyrophosphokinase [Candidatus Paceibacterota bacterium]MBT4680702.1 ribose-phosphate pyrophosphokinase [Candidatus Paceibacterota bacterium]